MYSGHNIIEEDVDNIIDIPKLFNIRKILKNCIDGELREAIETTHQLYETGYSANDILLTFLKYIENYKDYKEFDENNIDDKELYKTISSSYIRVNNGIDSYLQLCSCISSIYLLLNNKK